MVWSTDVNPCKRRNKEQAKPADRLGPKGTWPSAAAVESAAVDVAPPVQRRDLTHQVEFVERDKVRHEVMKTKATSPCASRKAPND